MELNYSVTSTRCRKEVSQPRYTHSFHNRLMYVYLGLLHTHAIQNAEFVIQNATYRDDCYINFGSCAVIEHHCALKLLIIHTAKNSSTLYGSFLFSSTQPNATTGDWYRVVDLRLHSLFFFWLPLFERTANHRLIMTERSREMRLCLMKICCTSCSSTLLNPRKRLECGRTSITLCTGSCQQKSKLRRIITNDNWQIELVDLLSASLESICDERVLRSC